MVCIWIALSTFSAITIFIQGQVITSPRVTIAQGTVVGSLSFDRTYYQFYGIPYADSTAGVNRFKAPSAPPRFESEFLANRKGVKCVRALGIGYEGTEDCLVLDIHTTTLDSSRNLPVMVWLQGKDLDYTNNPDLSFKKFMKEKVVVVNINYRESILGFLCLGTESAPGNAGLKDVIAGLRWIQQNIATFGGDPNNVILFGHGSGASIVDLITLSPVAEGLVHKAIAQSGTALAPWAVTRNNLKYAVQVAEALGHTVRDIDTLSDALSRTSVPALMGIINELDLTDNSLAFAPCVERNIENVEAVLLLSPYHTIIEGRQLQIPFMTGFVDNEGTLRANQALNGDWIVRMDETFEDFIQSDIGFLTEVEEKEIAKSIKTFYFGNQSVSSNNITNFLNYNGDTMILTAAIRESRMRVVSSPSAPVYLYQFSYSSALTEILEKPLPTESAGHKEELVYMFYDENEIEANTYDKAVTDIIIERWTNFAKTGVPSSITSQTLWEPFTSINSYYLRVLDDQEIINSESAIFDVQLQDPYPKTLSYWDLIYSYYFVDAESKWSLIERGDDGDVDTTPQGTTETPTEGTTQGENDDNSPGSASTAVGYTFVILTIFSLLNKFHNFQMLS